MKKIKTTLIALFVCALGYGSYSAYDYVTMSEAERFLLENIEALTQYEPGGSGDGSWDCDFKNVPCVVSASLASDLVKLNKFLASIGMGSVELAVTVNLTHLTQIYYKGGTSRCGQDKTCYDVWHP